jgi:hypothetical protein
MTAEKHSDTKPFPGSPTGNQSGVGTSNSTSKDTEATGKKPTAPYPGSPTGNASGVGDTPKAKENH